MRYENSKERDRRDHSCGIGQSLGLRTLGDESHADPIGGAGGRFQKHRTATRTRRGGDAVVGIHSSVQGSRLGGALRNFSPRVEPESHDATEASGEKAAAGEGGQGGIETLDPMDLG